MWAMMICCAAPLLLIALFGLGGKALGTSPWIILGGTTVMIIIHFITMGRSHKDSNDGDDQSKHHEDGKDHSHHGCCH